MNEPTWYAASDPNKSTHPGHSSLDKGTDMHWKLACVWQAVWEEHVIIFLVNKYWQTTNNNNNAFNAQDSLDEWYQNYIHSLTHTVFAGIIQYL